MSNVVQAGYSNMGYAGQGASTGGYGTAFSQAATGFGQAGPGMQAGQKRDSQYDQASYKSFLIVPLC